MLALYDKKHLHAPESWLNFWANLASFSLVASLILSTIAAVLPLRTPAALAERAPEELLEAHLLVPHTENVLRR